MGVLDTLQMRYIVSWHWRTVSVRANQHKVSAIRRFLAALLEQVKGI